MAGFTRAWFPVTVLAPARPLTSGPEIPDPQIPASQTRSRWNTVDTAGTASWCARVTVSWGPSSEPGPGARRWPF